MYSGCMFSTDTCTSGVYKLMINQKLLKLGPSAIMKILPIRQGASLSKYRYLNCEEACVPSTPYNIIIITGGGMYVECTFRQCVLERQEGGMYI